jgi:hypothetical protein
MRLTLTYLKVVNFDGIKLEAIPPNPKTQNPPIGYAKTAQIKDYYQFIL